MSEKLIPCPFCPGDTFITNAKGNAVICSNCGVEVVAEDWEAAVKQWNTRAPLYSPVKPEDIDCGKYFIRKDSMRANLIKFVTVDPDGRLIVYERSAEVGTVEDYVLRGHAFFRIPEVPKLGVAE